MGFFSELFGTGVTITVPGTTEEEFQKFKVYLLSARELCIKQRLLQKSGKR